MALTSRSRKEAHVSGLSGTSLAEVSAIAALPVALVLGVRCSPQLRAAKAGRARQLFGEWLVLVPAQLVCQLDLISAPALLVGVAGLLGGLKVLVKQRPIVQAPKLDSYQQLRDAITCFRASLLLITCMAILAVDFHAFPRRFGKAETFGTGLMDTGVGLFVLAGAIPAGVAAGLPTASKPRGRHRASSHLHHVAVLLALGLARAVATHAVGYQNHVGEYGVHWNFFLTLAVVRLTNMCLGRWAQPLTATASLGTALLLAHQWLLSGMGLSQLVNADGPRHNLLAANKEGLLSLPGYIALHWLGVALGQLLCQLAARSTEPQRCLDPGNTGKLSAQQAEDKSSAGQAPRILAGKSGKWNLGGGLLGQLAALDGVLWLACVCTSRAVEPISRRSCNLAYVLWMLALAVQGIGLFWGVASWQPGNVPALLQLLNDKLLPAFLIANMLTGLVNLSIDTLAVGWWGACATLSVYMAAVCSGTIAWALLRAEFPSRSKKHVSYNKQWQ